MNQHHILRPISRNSLGLLIRAFLDECELAGLSPNTLAGYRGTLERFEWWVGETGRELDPATLMPADLREYLRYVQSSPNRWNSPNPNTAKPIQGSSLDTYYRTLRRFFNWLVDQEYIDRSPMDKRLRPPRFQSEPINPFEPEELARLSRALRNLPPGELPARDRAIVAVLLDVGLRASELVNLTIDDLDVMSGVVVVRRGKGNKTRTVQLGSSARQAVRRYWIRYRADHVEDTTAPFFANQHNRLLTSWGLAQLTERIGKRAKVLPCNPHRFRHTAAISALRAGMGLLELQTILGHSSLEMVRHYARIAETDIARAAKESSPLDHLKLNL